MGFAVVHMQKIKGGGVRGIQSHNNREHPPRTNPDIDHDRTAQNYHLIHQDNYYRQVKKTIEDFATETKTVRKDAVVMCSFIITSDEQTMKAMSPEMQQEFFQDSMLWFSDRYGGENIVNATIHMDETTPHMHLGIVPITKDGRLSAKSIFTRKELSEIQTNFALEVGTKYGLERGKEGSERTHLSEQRFKLETTKKQNKEMNSKFIELSKKVALYGDDAKRTIKHLQDKKDTLEREIDALEREIAGRKLTINEITKINPQKTMTGAYKGITATDIENLKKTAIKGIQYEYEYNKLALEHERVCKRVPRMEERIQAAKDKERLAVLEKAFEALPAHIRQQILPQRQTKKNRSQDISYNR